MATPGAASFCLNPRCCGLPSVGRARYHRDMKMSRLALIAAGLLLLAACGNKGPLFLPQKPAPAAEELPPPPTEPASAALPAEEVPASPKDDGDGTPR